MALIYFFKIDIFSFIVPVGVVGSLRSVVDGNLSFRAVVVLLPACALIQVMLHLPDLLFKNQRQDIPGEQLNDKINCQQKDYRPNKSNYVK